MKDLINGVFFLAISDICNDAQPPDFRNGCGLQGHRSAGCFLLLPCPFHWPPTEHAQRRGPLTPKGKVVDVLI